MRFIHWLVVGLMIGLTGCGLWNPRTKSAEDLTPSEKTELSDIEQKRGSGEISEIEYDMLKNKLAPEQKIKF